MTEIDPAALQRAMDAAGVTPSRLADELGVSLSYIARIRRGERTLARNPVMRRRIAQALAVPMHWIERHQEAA